jgi:hypothetical protein
MDSRKMMIVSVSVLGVSILTVLLAYMAFGDNTDEDMKTIKQVNVKSFATIFRDFYAIKFIFIFR